MFRSDYTCPNAVKYTFKNAMPRKFTPPVLLYITCYDYYYNLKHIHTYTWTNYIQRDT